jgi:hypothetical protein
MYENRFWGNVYNLCISIDGMNCSCTCHKYSENSICCSCNCEYEKLVENPPTCLTPEMLGDKK